jgi:hypothetical protein
MQYMDNIGEDIEKLITSTIKLYMVCEKKGKVADGTLDLSKPELEGLMREDIALCRLRGELKNAINKAVGQTEQEIKRYGKD